MDEKLQTKKEEPSIKQKKEPEDKFQMVQSKGVKEIQQNKQI